MVIQEEAGVRGRSVEGVCLCLCQYISSTGMNYYSEFLLVETICPTSTRIVHKACKPLCPDRAVSTPEGTFSATPAAH